MRRLALLFIVALASALMALADGPTMMPDGTATITTTKAPLEVVLKYPLTPEMTKAIDAYIAKHPKLTDENNKALRWSLEVLLRANIAHLPLTGIPNDYFRMAQDNPFLFMYGFDAYVNVPVQHSVASPPIIINPPAPAQPDTRILMMPPATVNVAAPITLPAPKLSLVVLPAVNIVLAGGGGASGATPLRGTAASRALQSLVEHSSMQIGSVSVINLPDRKQEEDHHHHKPKPGDDCDDWWNKPHPPPPGDGGGDGHHPPPGDGGDDGNGGCSNGDTNGDGIVDSHDDTWSGDGGHQVWDDPGNPTNEGAGWTEDDNTPPPPEDHGTSGGGNEPPPSGAY